MEPQPHYSSYWTPVSESHYQGMIQYIGRSNIISLDFDAFLGYLTKTLEEAFDANDTQRFIAALRVVDEKTDDGTCVRFKYAIRSMMAKKYELAYIAWDDGGMCWSDCAYEDDPEIPPSDVAAKCLRDACKEILFLKSELQSRDLADDLKKGLL